MGEDQIVENVQNPGQLGQWMGGVNTRLTNIEVGIERIENTLTNHIATEVAPPMKRETWYIMALKETGKAVFRPLILVSLGVGAVAILAHAGVHPDTLASLLTDILEYIARM